MFINTKKQAARAAEIANKMSKSEGVTFTASDFYKKYATNVLNQDLSWNTRLQNAIARAIVAELAA